MFQKRLQSKNVYFALLLRIVAILSFSIGVAGFSFWTKEFNTPHAHYVKVSPAVDFNTLTDHEIIHYRADYFISYEDVKDRHIPFYEYHISTIQVWVNGEGRVFFNGFEFGNTSHTGELINKLSSVFRDRTYHRIFAENSGEIDKKVVVVAAHSLKYGEMTNVIDAIKTSGSDPIVLDSTDLKNFRLGPD